MEITNIISQLPRNGRYMARPLSAITKIAVHWDAWERPHEYDSVSRYVQEAQMHINKDWGGGAHGDGIMYHYKIDNTGVVFQCRDLTDVLWNVGGNANYWTIAVCFDCGQYQSITKEQGEAFLQLMEELCWNHPEFPASQGDVAGHREFNSTQCPGDQIMNKMVLPYRSSRTVDLSGLVYDWPAETPAPAPKPEPTPAPVVTPAPVEVTPPPVVVPPVVITTPENGHTSQVDSQPTQPTVDTVKTQPGASTQATDGFFVALVKWFISVWEKITKKKG